MARQRHLYWFSGEPSGYVSRTCMKSVHSCNITIPTKSPPERNPKPNRKSVLFWIFLVIFSDIFCHLQVSYFNELLPEIYSHEHQNWSLQSKALWDVKLRRSRVFIGGRVRRRPVKFRCFAMKQEVVITQACNVRCAPKFPCLIRLRTWRDLGDHIHIIS